MKQIRLIIGLLSMGLFLAVTGCSSLSLEAPTGFAVEEDRGSLFRGISPEGVVFRVSLEENEPVQSAEFWQEVLRRQMLKEGYQLVSEGELSVEGKRGFFFEWGAPRGQDDYIYLTGVLRGETHLAVAEAAAEVSLYRQYRQSLMDCINTITF